MKTMKAESDRRGFTLVELLVVIIIIAVLAAVVVPRFASSSTRSRESGLRSDLKTLRDAIKLFHADTTVYPAALIDLTAAAAPAKGKQEDGSDKAIVPSDFR